MVSTYLAIMDQFLDWLSIFKLPKDNSDEVIKILRGYFANWGIQKEASTDCEKNFVSEKLKDFLSRMGVKCRQSTAYNATSNKRAEVAVKTAKRLVMEHTNAKHELDSDGLLRALIENCSTPNSVTGLSPANVVFGREIKGFCHCQRSVAN